MRPEHICPHCQTWCDCEEGATDCTCCLTEVCELCGRACTEKEISVGEDAFGDPFTMCPECVPAGAPPEEQPG